MIKETNLYPLFALQLSLFVFGKKTRSSIYELELTCFFQRKGSIYYNSSCLLPSYCIDLSANSGRYVRGKNIGCHVGRHASLDLKKSILFVHEFLNYNIVNRNSKNKNISSALPTLLVTKP